MRALAKLPFDYPPGSGTQYSDVGFIILGEVVARVSGLPLDRYLERAVFKPLGLKDTTFNPGPALRARIAPTEWANGHMLLGEVHDPRARDAGRRRRARRHVLDGGRTSRGSAACSWTAGRWTAARCSSRPPSR